MRAISGNTAQRIRPSRERLRCFVIERGARELAVGSSDEFDQTVVVAQLPDETPLAFAQRVLARIAGVERSGRQLESTELLIGDAHDAAAKAARRLIVLGTAAHAQAHDGRTELLLSAAAEPAPQAKTELLGLVDEIWASSPGRPVPVRLRFGDPQAPSPRRSGVFPVPTRGLP